MGFPMSYPDLPLPRLLLSLVFLLGYVRRLLSSAFSAAGLGDLLDSDLVSLPAAAVRRPEFRSASAMLIKVVLPVVRYADLVREGGGGGGGQGAAAAGECAVCLYELEDGDEVRRLSNCRHVFHRCCIDRWMEHDQRTCPLCRAPLLPEEMMQDYALNDCVWAAAGIPDSYDDDEISSSSSFPFESPWSPDLLAPHNLVAQN